MTSMRSEKLDDMAASSKKTLVARKNGSKLHISVGNGNLATKRPRSKHVAHPLEAPTALRRLEPRTALVEQVVERLREGICGGEFPPGSELPAEGKLAKSSIVGQDRKIVVGKCENDGPKFEEALRRPALVGNPKQPIMLSFS